MGCVSTVTTSEDEPKGIYEKCPVGKLKIHFYSLSASS